MRILRVIYLAALFSMVQLLVMAQTPEVSGRIEPDTISIGDYFTYTIEVKRDIAQVTEFPIFELGSASGEGIAEIELIESMPVDTLSKEGRRLHLRKRYRMQVFDEGRISMGRSSVLYADKNIIDTLYAGDTLYLWVEPIVIDSLAATQGLKPIKPQKSLPFKFGEISGYMMWGVVILLILAALIYALKRYLEARGRRLQDLFKPAPPLPPHVVAIRALEALHHRKLWQNGKSKLYYSELTDILRTYIASRYEVGAMEMTSDEILSAMRNLSEEELPKKSAMDLDSVLKEADLVKFAKAEPTAEENESAYNKAFFFVEETKLQEAEPSEGEGIENA